MNFDFEAFEQDMQWLWAKRPALAQRLEFIANVCHMELGRQTARLQETQAMIRPLEDRIGQLSGYIDKLITKIHGPGTYELDGETWSTEEIK